MKASVVTAYGGPEVMKYQDMPDPKPGAGDVLVRVAGIGINPEDMLDRNGVTRDRYRSAGCRFKSNGADVRADSRRSSRTSDQAKKSDVHSNYSKAWRRCTLLWTTRVQ
jgi:hypothetical protein